MLFECIDESAVLEFRGYTLTYVHRLSGPSDQVVKIRTAVHYESSLTASYACVEVLNDHFEWMPLVSESVMTWHQRVTPVVVTHEAITDELGHIASRLIERAGNILY